MARCENCRHCEILDNKTNIGLCRYNPPVGGDIRIPKLAQYPLVRLDDPGCSHYQAVPCSLCGEFIHGEIHQVRNGEHVPSEPACEKCLKEQIER